MSEINSQLALWNQLEANREKRRQYENTLRQFVFEQELILSDLVDPPTSTPATKWFVATIIKQNIGNVAVSSASFQEFVDKDRVVDLQRRLDQVIEENQRKLSLVELVRLQEAVKILKERSTLEEFITILEAKEFLEHTQSTWHNAQLKLRTHTILLWVLVFSPALICVVSITLFVVLVFIVNATEFGWLIASVLTVVFLVLVAYVSFRTFQLLQSDNGWKETPEVVRNLKQQRTAALLKIPSEDRIQFIENVFGKNVTSEDLKRERGRREAEIKSILGLS